MKPNMSKFSWSELFSNTNGKTSGSGFSGVVICLVGTFCFFLGCLDKIFISQEIDIISQSIVFVGIGATLLGARKYLATKTETTTDKVVNEEKKG
jgi:hypothetical protein